MSSHLIKKISHAFIASLASLALFIPSSSVLAEDTNSIVAEETNLLAVEDTDSITEVNVNHQADEIKVQAIDVEPVTNTGESSQEASNEETTIESSEETTTTVAFKATKVEATTTTTESITLPEELNDDSFDKDGSRFTLTIIPDTQFYSRYGTEESGNQFKEYGKNPFISQTEWIAKYADKFNDQLTLHLGDIVDQANKDKQWEIADQAMKVLEDAGHPYSILAGNHDMAYWYWYYDQTFNEERAKKNKTLEEAYVHDFGNFKPKGHEYHKFNVDGQDYINLALSWDLMDPDYGEVFDWAEGILKANPDTPTIISSHQIINIDNNTGEAIDTEFGNRLWDRLVGPYNQVFLTYNGHHHGATHRVQKNQSGNDVLQVLTDHQMAYMGGNGYMMMAEFDLTNNKIHHTTFSPWVIDKPKDKLTTFDKALMTDKGATFTYDFDFAKRFPNLVVGPTVEASYTKKLRETILAAYEEPEVTPLTPAKDKDDYVEVEGTVAHWRMSEGREGLEDKTPLPIGTQIIDIANPENTMVRVPSTGPANPDDVLFSKDHSVYSADAGSIVFNNVSRKQPYPDGSLGETTHLFSTNINAPINFEEFKEGYTFETFIKINPNVDNENRWMRWIARDGFRRDHEKYDNDVQGDEGEPLFQWALSNLREIQFSVADAKDESIGKSAWSGEITNLGQWIHLAAVNNPEDMTITMYVDGQPVLRNATDQLGIASLGLPWLIGGDYRDNGMPGHGFLGAIGETRLVKRMLEPTEWLTARRVVPDIVTPVEPEEPIIVDPVIPEEPIVEPEAPVEIDEIDFEWAGEGVGNDIKDSDSIQITLAIQSENTEKEVVKNVSSNNLGFYINQPGQMTEDNVKALIREVLNQVKSLDYNYYERFELAQANVPAAIKQWELKVVDNKLVVTYGANIHFVVDLTQAELIRNGSELLVKLPEIKVLSFSVTDPSIELNGEALADVDHQPAKDDLAQKVEDKDFMIKLIVKAEKFFNEKVKELLVKAFA